MTPFALLSRGRAVILPLLLVPMALLPAALAPPAQASGFLTDGPFEVQAGAQCANDEDFGCVDVISDAAIDLWSDELVEDAMTWTSLATSSPYIVSFVLNFTSQAQGSYAFYKVGNDAENQFFNLNNASFTVSLDANDTLTFGVANGESASAQVLGVSEFEANINNGGDGGNDPSAVPAPLPLLGGAGAFAIIRRRRARLRAAAQAQ